MGMEGEPSTNDTCLHAAVKTKAPLSSEWGQAVLFIDSAMILISNSQIVAQIHIAKTFYTFVLELCYHWKTAESQLHIFQKLTLNYPLSSII